MRSLSSKLPPALKQKAVWLSKLNQQLYAILPTELHQHVQVAGLNHGILTLETNSPTWAAKLRYRSRDIASQLSVKSGLSIKSAKVLIRPKAIQKTTIKRQPPCLPLQSAKQLSALADSINHPDLKRALATLASRKLSKK